MARFKLFSERMGHKSPKDLLQIDAIDQDLKIGLWNALTIYIWENMPSCVSDDTNVQSLMVSLWIDFFKRPYDTKKDYNSDMVQSFKTSFFGILEWYEIYDFIEFILNKYNFEKENEFIDYCNEILGRESSGYRIVQNNFVPIISNEEINEVDKAAQTPYDAVNAHISCALDLMSDKSNPDYRNSIKESISAVEALCKIISGNDKATLGEALKDLEKNHKLEMHGALKSGFDKLYGYTNDVGGIRHSLLEQSTIGLEDARFMLISCSAFVNYLNEKNLKSNH